MANMYAILANLIAIDVLMIDDEAIYVGQSL